jgi:hypothetical protein
LVGKLTPAEAQRWAEIKRTFKKNLLLRGAGEGQDPVTLVVGQLAAFSEGLDSIQQVLAAGAAQRAQPPAAPVTVILMPATAPAVEAAPKPAPTDAGTAAPPPAVPGEDSLREVKITPETLKKIWELVEKQPKPASGETPPAPAG